MTIVVAFPFEIFFVTSRGSRLLLLSRMGLLPFRNMLSLAFLNETLSSYISKPFLGFPMPSRFASKIVLFEWKGVEL